MVYPKEDLTDAQRVRLDALVVHLSKFPTPELIAVSGKLRLPEPLDESGKARYRLSMAGAIACEKIGYYERTLQSFENERLSLGERAHQCEATLSELPRMDRQAAAQAYLDLITFSGYQEVTFHFWVICVARISRLLKLVQGATDYRIPKNDEVILESYRPLRNLFEHLESETHGKRGKTDVAREEEDEHEWRLIFGFESDHEGRIVLNGQTIDVTSRGLAAVQGVVERSFIGARTCVLNQVRNHFRQNPEKTPSPEEIPADLLVGIHRDWPGPLSR